MPEVERIDDSSDTVHVSAVSILTPEGQGFGGTFEVFTLMVETNGTRYLVGFEEDGGKWTKFWKGDTTDSYEEASEQWMRDRYSDRITDEQRLDADDESD